MITKEAFIENYCKQFPKARSKITSGKLVPMPCNCTDFGEEDDHWAMVINIDPGYVYTTHIIPCIWRWRNARK